MRCPVRSFVNRAWRGTFSLVLVLVGVPAFTGEPLDVPVAAAPASKEAKPGPTAAERVIQDFLEKHWARPLPPQGSPPPSFTPIEASLAPKDCGVCHPAQLADWQTSFHAKAMGPGVAGQLVDMIRQHPAGVRDCQACHAPLAEQMEQNPGFSRTLQAEAVTCGGCHVRGWDRFGPPKRDGSPVSATPQARLPHHGATRTPAFLRSEFCKSCHQFDADGFALNGKLLENTYEEWRASPYAARGIQCQECHMPDRRHLWRGIHDPEMVQSGVTVDLKLSKAKYRVGERVEASLTVTNRRVGHRFPTYLTPKVFLRMELVDPQGLRVRQSGEEAVIGREATLDLSEELYDTRLPPAASFTMKYARRIDRSGLRLRARVVVEPDHFYTKFFTASVPQAQRGRRQLEAALAQTHRSGFSIFSKEVSLD